jgi:hypothetical protein
LYLALHTASVALLRLYREVYCGGCIFLELEPAECTLSTYMADVRNNPALQLRDVIREYILSALVAYSHLRYLGFITEDNAANLMCVKSLSPVQLQTVPPISVTHVIKFADLDSCFTFADQMQIPHGSLTLARLLHHLSTPPNAKKGAARRIIYVDSVLKQFFQRAKNLVLTVPPSSQSDETKLTSQLIVLAQQYLFGKLLLLLLLVNLAPPFTSCPDQDQGSIDPPPPPPLSPKIPDSALPEVPLSRVENGEMLTTHVCII